MPLRKPKPHPIPVAMPVQTPPQTERLQAPRGAADPPVFHEEGGPAASEAVAPASRNAAVGGDPMMAYLELVRRRLQARLAVPAEARRLRLGGTVVVRFAVAADGSVAETSLAVVSGSGAGFLTQAARTAVLDSAPLPMPPKAAIIEVPVVFAIR
ncbi:TonB family protein [Azospirillum sp. sgz301742]